jgi:hypothetical protein
MRNFLAIFFLTIFFIQALPVKGFGKRMLKSQQMEEVQDDCPDSDEGDDADDFGNLGVKYRVEGFVAHGNVSGELSQPRTSVDYFRDRRRFRLSSYVSEVISPPPNR